MCKFNSVIVTKTSSFSFLFAITYVNGVSEDFNVKNCKLLRITKNRMPFHADLKLNGCSLDETYEF